MSLEVLCAPTTREAPSAPMRERFIAPRVLTACCVCGLIRDGTESSPDRERWVTQRTYRKTHGINPADFLLTHTYCPECFTQFMGTVSQYLRKSCRFSPISETQHRAEEGP